MKKIFLAAALMSMASISSFALTMTSSCASGLPTSITPVAGIANANLSCVGFPVALPVDAINVSYTFQYGVDFTVDQFNAANPSITFSFTNPGTGLTVTNVVSTVGSTGIVTVGPVGTTGSDASYFSAFTSAFTSTVSSNITNVSVSGRFLVNYDPAPSGVPEPSTVALMGAGLVGVAAYARRKR
jgi:hypothetical protein